MFNLKNIILISKNGKQYKSRVLLRSRCRCCSGIPCPRSYASSSSNAEPLLLLMMEGKSRTDVATLPRQRCDVETSRRYCLLTVVLVDPTSRCWDVTMWGRRDVGTSRRSSHLHTLLSIAPNCFQSLLFSTHLHLHSPN